MENLPPNLVPTLVDISTIEELDPLNDSTDLLEEIRQQRFQEERRKILKRANVFTEDDRVKFKNPTPKPESGELQKTDIKSKTIAAIVIIVIMIVVSIVVVKKHKRFRKEDVEILADPNAPYSLFRNIRSTDLGCNALIAAEIFMYLIVLLGFAYLIKKITKQTNETFN
jgi:hypothetical protein